MSTTEEITAINVRDILRSIQLGDYDDHLESIHDAVRERRRARVSAAAAEITGSGKFAVGQRVRLCPPVHPLYMVGKEGTVTKVNRTTYGVELDDKTTRFGANPRVPADMLEAI